MREYSPLVLLQALRRFLFPARRTALRELLGELVEAVRVEGYHFSDILIALADYAQIDSSIDEDTEQTRATVVTLLQQAAQAAERPGREIP